MLVDQGAEVNALIRRIMMVCNNILPRPSEEESRNACMLHGLHRLSHMIL